MKKVRYAIGAVAPALGLIVPATATAAVTHVPQKTGKTVSLRHSGTIHSETTCGGTHSKSITASSRGIHASLFYRHNCMLNLGGYMHPQGSGGSNYFVRTRVYSVHGAKVFSGRTNTTYSSGLSLFFQRIDTVGDRACETAFLRTSPHTRVYGPTCETI